MAGLGGLEPPVLVLETSGLPINRQPLFSKLFMKSVFSADIAIFI